MKECGRVDRPLHLQDVKNILLLPFFLEQVVQSQLHSLTSVDSNFFLFKITDYFWHNIFQLSLGLEESVENDSKIWGEKGSTELVKWPMKDELNSGEEKPVKMASDEKISWTMALDLTILDTLKSTMMVMRMMKVMQNTLD